MKTKNIATMYAILAATLYAINIPVSKILLNYVEPTMMASFLYLGAAKTSAYYSIAPFLGEAFSMFILNERPGIQFFVAFIIIVISTCLMVNDTIKLQHTHMGDSENHRHEHDFSEYQHIHYA